MVRPADPKGSGSWGSLHYTVAVSEKGRRLLRLAITDSGGDLSTSIHVSINKTRFYVLPFQREEAVRALGAPLALGGKRGAKALDLGGHISSVDSNTFR
jgi:hypothetical protein